MSSQHSRSSRRSGSASSRATQEQAAGVKPEAKLPASFVKPRPHIAQPCDDDDLDLSSSIRSSIGTFPVHTAPKESRSSQRSQTQPRVDVTPRQQHWANRDGSVSVGGSIESSLSLASPVSYATSRAATERQSAVYGDGLDSAPISARSSTRNANDIRSSANSTKHHAPPSPAASHSPTYHLSLERKKRDNVADSGTVLQPDVSASYSSVRDDHASRTPTRSSVAAFQAPEKASNGPPKQTLANIMSFLDDVEKEADEEAESVSLSVSLAGIPLGVVDNSATAGVSVARHSDQRGRDGSSSHRQVDKQQQKMPVLTKATSPTHSTHSQRTTRSNRTDQDLNALRESLNMLSPASQQKLLHSPAAGQTDSGHAGTRPNVRASSSTLAISVFDGIKNKMMGMKLQLEDREQTVTLLRQTLDSIKQKHSKEMARVKAEADEHKRKTESHLQRQMSMVEQLLSDKDELTQQCQALTTQMQELEARYRSLMEQQQEQFDTILKQKKASWSQAEKVRREQWIAEKTKSIKQMTIKGLEPELQGMLAQHKADMARAEHAAKEMLIKQEQRLHQQYTDRESEIRRDYLKDRDTAVEDERKRAGERLRTQIERYDLMLQEQREKLRAEHEHERQLWEAAKREEITGLREEVSAARRGESRSVRDLKEQHDRQLEEQGRKHALALKEEQRRFDIEKQQWQHMMMGKMQEAAEQREELLRKELSAERDEEVKMIISRLSAEQDSRVAEATKKYCDEIADLKKGHSEALQAAIARENRVKAQLAALQAEHADAQSRADRQTEEIERVKAQLQQAGQEHEHLVSRLDHAQRALSEREKEISQSVDKEVRQMIKENESLQRQVMDITNTLQRQKDSLNAEHEQELKKVLARFSAALDKKDVTIGTLKEAVTSKDRRIAHIEKLLEQQRQELMEQLQM